MGEIITIKDKLLEYIKAGDISRAKTLFQDRDEEVEEAMIQSDPEKHKIMMRRDKSRKKSDPYITEKLPRNWQNYINEVSLFFLLGKPIEWSELSGEDSVSEAFDEFKKFLANTRFNSNMRAVKRLAGKETECAKLYHLYDDDGVPGVKAIILSKSKGYSLRPLFDRYNNMIAFAYGYTLKEVDKRVEHFDIYTSKTNYFCRRVNTGWEVEERVNILGKIPVIYYKQDVEWKGSQHRIERDEYIDSITADTNNYFADPIAKVTADSVDDLPDPEQVGRIVQLTDKDSIFEYLSPPTATEMKDSEKEVIRSTILSDTFTPDFSFENLSGMGSLSGEALKRSLILGYMKADNRKEIYDELVDREKNIILAIMKEVTHISLRNSIDTMEVHFEFAEPFDQDTENTWTAIRNCYVDGVMSLETAVKRIGVANTAEEVAAIQAEKNINAENEFYPVD